MADEANAIGLKLPEFWRQNVRLWFIQVEAAFVASGIVQDNTKYYNVVAKLDGSLLPYVSDIISQPPANEKYVALKNRIISAFDDSPVCKLDKVLHSALGDKKPSQLYRDMIMTGGANLTPDAIKQLWLMKLPQNLSAVLSVSTAPIDQIVQQADTMIEYQESTTSVASVCQDNEIKDLKGQIADLNRKIQEMSVTRSRSPSHNRAPGRRFRSLSPRNSSSSLCWYHAKFGNKATKCKPPCNFSKN